MKPELAVDDKHTPFSHVAFTWEPDQGMWEFLCAGRTLGKSLLSRLMRKCWPKAAPPTPDDLEIYLPKIRTQCATHSIQFEEE